jgi:hypothetical protein
LRLNTLDEEDFDGFTVIVSSIKDGGGNLARRRQWLTFLRLLCAPYFNKQEPETTGDTVFYQYDVLTILNLSQEKMWLSTTNELL